MDAGKLKNIFLSASIPLPERDQKYYHTADIIAIRDAVISLATVALPTCKLVWGGHPSITPLIYYVLQRMDLKINEHITLFQSRFFEKYFPEDNNKFNNVILTDKQENKPDSLKLMRTKMFESGKFDAAIFIGGMEGVEDEYSLFCEMHPEALLLPIASTGAAAKIVYDNYFKDKNERFEKDYAYMSLFQKYLIDKIK